MDAQDGVGGPNGYARGTGWYRQTVVRPAVAAADRLLLHFGGASLVTSVYLDGAPVGTHAGAFAAFDVDVTAALADGLPHTLAVGCNNSLALSQTVAPSSGADVSVDGGLYRGVSLVAVPPVHLSTADGASGVMFSTPAVSTASAGVRVETKVAAGSGTVVVRSVLADAAGTIVADTAAPLALKSANESAVVQTADVVSPHLWNGKADPYLYDLYVEVRDPAGSLLDLVHQKVGIRTSRSTRRTGSCSTAGRTTCTA